MKIILGIIFLVIVLASSFYAWFYFYFLKVAGLKVPSVATTAERVAIIDAWFSDLQKANKFNGAVLVKKESEILLAKGYGFTSHRKEVSVTANSSFRLASVSKQFTATGVMILKEQRELSYDDLVTKYIPDLPYKKVTIRNLLNQTSGIPDIYMKLARDNKSEISILTNEMAVDLLISENKPADNEPLVKYEYSNTNYILLARIIELVSGLAFEEFMGKELFTPLGMENSRVWNLLSEEDTFANKTVGFENLQGETTVVKPNFLDGVAGDGAIFSSISDLAKWDDFWYGNPLLSEENIAEAFTKPVLTDGTSSDYGFGWLITENGMWHNGDWLAAKTILIRNTKRKTCIAILDNSSNLFFDKIIETLKEASPII